MKAVIRGDWHASKHDSRALFNREQNEIDVLYIEGRSDIIDIEDRGAPYVLFLIGYFSLELLYSFVSWAYRHLPGDIDIHERAESMGWRVEDEIDVEIHDMFDETAESTTWRLFVLEVTLVGFAFMWAAAGEPSFGIPPGVLSSFLLLLLPFGYFGFLLLLGIDTPHYRDKEMADYIITDAEASDAQSVLVFVGDQHVSKIADILEEEGWNVSRERSSHPISRFSRFVWKLTGVPIFKIRRWISDIGQRFARVK